ncbi:DnaJ-like subfamily C member 1 [Papilio xuthus]|uniref:DnaJ-like subfamily C member 1 n=1 Tax=Papilio xuthus TaxID=66420 RepID=A0A194QNE4_PAPXU|nr:DnaJ-like subfamily C member 1 [Papilio xuthus]
MRFVILVFLAYAASAAAWDDDDFEVFDVVEEVNQNFYELLGVTQEASQQEIKSAFKKLTLKLHPDKNSAPDADVQFRNLVSVHNILKDPGKREKYNEVLKNGLPNWRSAVYYYRHEQILNSRGRKLKKSGFDTGLAEILEKLPKPSIKDTLPFQIPRFLWWMVTAVPRAIMELKRQMKEREEEAKRQKKKEEEERVRAERDAAAAEARAASGAGGGAGGARRRRGFVPPEREACLLDAADEPHHTAPTVQPAKTTPPVITGGLWTDEDLAELVRLVKKYPGGTPERWERIATAMGRGVPEVTHVAARLKDNCYKIPGQEPPEETVIEPPKKVKTRKAEEGGGGGSWSQSQQRALETALAKHPKGGAGDRWQKIAAAVPGKTKEECMQRCKYLSDVVRKQKQKEEEEREAQKEETSDAQKQDEEITS